MNSADKIKKKAQFLFSREALLDHLKETESVLAKRITASSSKEPIYQKELIQKYITLQDDLAQLKKVAVQLKSANISSDPQQQWDNKSITSELRQLLASFNNFLKTTGFISS